MVKKDKSLPLADGTVYSRRKNFCPFSAHPLQDYASVIGEEKVEKLQRVAQLLEGLKLLEINATAQGGAWPRCFTAPTFLEYDGDRGRVEDYS